MAEETIETWRERLKIDQAAFDDATNIEELIAKSFAISVDVFAISAYGANDIGLNEVVESATDKNKMALYSAIASLLMTCDDTIEENDSIKIESLSRTIMILSMFS